MHRPLASARCSQPWSLILYALIGYAVLLTPRLLHAQSRVASTSLSGDERGMTIATVSGAGPAAYHPSHVLVRFRNGARREFLAGSGPARSFGGDADLYLVNN